MKIETKKNVKIVVIKTGILLIALVVNIRILLIYITSEMFYPSRVFFIALFYNALLIYLLILIIRIGIKIISMVNKGFTQEEIGGIMIKPIVSILLVGIIFIVSCESDPIKQEVRTRFGDLSNLSNEKLLEKYAEVDTNLKSYETRYKVAKNYGVGIVPTEFRDSLLRANIKIYTEAKKQMSAELEKRGLSLARDTLPKP